MGFSARLESRDDMESLAHSALWRLTILMFVLCVPNVTCVGFLDDDDMMAANKRQRYDHLFVLHIHF